MLDSDVWISMADSRCHSRVQINEVRDPDRTIRKAGDSNRCRVQINEVSPPAIDPPSASHKPVPGGKTTIQSGLTLQKTESS